MGVDIHLHLVKSKKVVVKDIFDGRNSEWFGNLQQNWSSSDEYDELPAVWHIIDEAPDDLIKESQEEYFYGHRSIKVANYKSWFTTYRPDIDAGWVTTYEKWQYERKGIVPEDLCHFLDPDVNKDDVHFMEFVNPYDCSAWLYQYLVDNEIDNEAWIIYWFDC